MWNTHKGLFVHTGDSSEDKVLAFSLLAIPPFELNAVNYAL